MINKGCTGCVCLGCKVNDRCYNCKGCIRHKRFLDIPGSYFNGTKIEKNIFKVSHGTARCIVLFGVVVKSTTDDGSESSEIVDYEHGIPEPSYYVKKGEEIKVLQYDKELIQTEMKDKHRGWMYLSTFKHYFMFSPFTEHPKKIRGWDDMWDKETEKNTITFFYVWYVGVDSSTGNFVVTAGRMDRMSARRYVQS